MSRRVPLEEAATISQVESEIHALSDADNARIRQYARKLARGLGNTPKGRSHQDLMQDLMQDAVVCSLSGDRRWNPGKVDFVGFLCGAMKSIASNWRNTGIRAGGFEVLCDDRPSDQADPNPLLTAVTPEADPEREAIAKDELERIDRLFEADSLVRDIIAGMAAGMSGPEIMECTGASEKEYRAAVRRLRRGVGREGGS